VPFAIRREFKRKEDTSVGKKSKRCISTQKKRKDWELTCEDYRKGTQGVPRKKISVSNCRRTPGKTKPAGGLRAEK